MTSDIECQSWFVEMFDPFCEEIFNNLLKICIASDSKFSDIEKMEEPSVEDILSGDTEISHISFPLSLLAKEEGIKGIYAHFKESIDYYNIINFIELPSAIDIKNPYGAKWVFNKNNVSIRIVIYKHMGNIGVEWRFRGIKK